MAITMKNVLWTVAVAAVTAFTTSQVVSQSHDHNDHKGQNHNAHNHGQEMPPEMKAWIEAGTPGAQHEELMKGAGRWDQVNTNYWSGTPEQSKSTMVAEPIMGGRYLQQHISGPNPHVPSERMEGMCIIGYDNVKQKYFFVWLDNNSTSVMYAEGTADDSGKAVTYYSSIMDPLTKSPVEAKCIWTSTSDDNHVFEMHMKDDNGNWMKGMQVESTRKAAHNSRR